MPPPSGVNNIFALLDDDNENEDDGFTVVSKPAKQAQAPAKAAKETEPKREVRKQKTDRPARGKGDKRREDRPYDGSDKPEKPAQEEGRKGKGERREGGKGERKRGKGGARREFDRHSGTGRGKGSAREGRGSYNWGEKTDGAPESAPEVAPADSENKVPPAPVQEEEEEENTMTLEEYMKAQASKAPVGKILTERKVENTAEGFLFSRDDEDVGHDDAMYGMAFHDYDGKKKEHEEKEARDGWVDADNVFNLKFVDPTAGGKGDRQGKGGKKGGRNDRNRDGGRGQKQRPQQGKIELSDVNAFPSLA